MKRLVGALAALCLVATPAIAADTIKAVRQTMATHDANEATLEAAQQAAIAAQSATNAAQDARLKALEDKLAAMGSVATSTAPAPAPAPAPVYPIGVAKAGLQAVYDARPGTVRPLIKTLGPGVPAGAYGIDAITVGFKGGGSIADTDASGLDYYFNGGAFTWSNIKFSHPGAGWYHFAVGHENGVGGPAQLTLTNVLVDEFATDPSRGSIVVSPGSKLTVRGASFLRANGSNLNLLGDSDIADAYFDAPGQQANPDSHTEDLHYGGGNHSCTRCFLDARAWAGHNSRATGLIYVEGWTGSPVVTLKDSILAGAGGIASLSPFQIFTKAGLSATLIMDNVVIQRGPGNGSNDRAQGPAAMGYIYWGPGIRVSCHNCRDYDTGDLIDDLMNFNTL